MLAALLSPRARTGDVVKGCRSAIREDMVIIRSKVVGFWKAPSFVVLNGGNTAEKEPSLSRSQRRTITAVGRTA